MSTTPDRVLRAMTNDGAFRVIVARTTESVRGAVAAQKATGATAGALGDLVSGAILFRETMAPTLRVQAALRGKGSSGQIIADSHPEGWSRALLQQPEKAPPFEVEGGQLMMMRSMPSGDLQKGVVLVPEGGDVSEGLMQYLQQSEQITSMTRLATHFGGGAVRAAGGYLVQVLPEAPDREAALMVMAQRLESDFNDITAWVERGEADPDALLHALLSDMPFTRLDDSEVRPGCDCSLVRVLHGLSTIGRDDLQELVDAEETLDIGCDWCGTQYKVAPEDLRGLLSES